MNWLHKLFNPHCSHCVEESECRSCETLKTQLDHERFEKEKLLSHIIELTRPSTPVIEERKELPLPLINRGWKAKKALLEAEDRRTAQLQKQKATELAVVKPMTTEELEKGLGVDENAS